MRKFGHTISAAALALGFGMVTPAFAATSTVTVQPGNTMWTISRTHGVSLQALEAANPSVNPNNMLVGTVLRLPGTAAVTRAATATLQQQNLYWMEHVINAEAAGQSLQAQIAVGDVILHRMQDGYGSSVKSVVFQVAYGHYQFTSVANGYIYTTPSASSIQAAIDVLNHREDIVPGALVFYNPAQTPAYSWVWTQPTVARYDNLVFAK